MPKAAVIGIGVGALVGGLLIMGLIIFLIMYACGAVVIDGDGKIHFAKHSKEEIVRLKTMKTRRSTLKSEPTKNLDDEVAAAETFRNLKDETAGANTLVPPEEDQTVRKAENDGQEIMTARNSVDNGWGGQ